MKREITDTITLHQGDCLQVMRSMPDNSVDSIVTDPPYGLSDHKPAEVLACLSAWIAGQPYEPKGRGFMGKKWDAWVPGPEIWREALRVLKPGGHALIFAGTRSMDLMCMALRLAGFELRDSIGYAHDGGGAPLLAWVQGSGFPKSLDVSKAIDKLDGSATQRENQLRFTAWLRGPGLAQRVAESQGTAIKHYRRPERSFRSVEHRQAVASLPCAKCGIVGFSQAAHANAGKGLGLKTSDALTFPLCCTRPGIVGCHVLHDQGGIYTREERARIEWESVDATRAALIRQNKWPAYVESAYLKAIAPLARMVHGEQKECPTSVGADSGVAHN